MAETVTPESVEQKVIDAIAEMGPEREEITRDATFEELDVDSLDLVELTQMVEEEFGVQIKGEDAQQMQTVGDAIDFVVSRAS
ncbi:MAG: acyl carrier protein [Actinomycetota bacterium]|nr:acyl carrier protein [Actinomycetota bacterium]